MLSCVAEMMVQMFGETQSAFESFSISLTNRMNYSPLAYSAWWYASSTCPAGTTAQGYACCTTSQSAYQGEPIRGRQQRTSSTDELIFIGRLPWQGNTNDDAMT